jgi:hypothetical protein
MDEDKASGNPQVKGMMPSMLAAVVLLIGGIADAYMLYTYAWYKSSLVIVFGLGFLAYCLGLWIEKRRGA